MTTDIKETKRLCKKYVDIWLRKVGKYGWSMTIKYANTELEMPRYSYSAYANCNAEFDYLRATISINLERIAQQNSSEKDIEYIVVHEFMHVVTNPMNSGSMSLKDSEYTATVLAQLITSHIFLGRE